MTKSEFSSALLAMMAACGAMIVFSLLRYRRRGLSSLMLAGAFGSLAALLAGIRFEWPMAAKGTFGVAIALFLIGDFAVRSGGKP